MCLSDRIAEFLRLITALAIVGGFALAPVRVSAQEPPPPPPAPERPEQDESDNEDEAKQREDLGEDELPLPPPPTPEALEGGGAPSAPTAPDAPDAQSKKQSPAKTYDAQFLRIARTQGDPIAHQFRYGTSMIAVRGTFNSIVDPPEFYQKVGRPELAQKYKRRSTSRMILLGSSVIVGSAGSYVFLVAGAAAEPFCFTTCTPQQQRMQRTANVLYGLSAATFVGGLVGFFGSLFWSAHPVDVDQRRALADEHNESLKRELGLPSDYSAERRRPPIEVRLSGAPTDGGAIGVLTLEF